MHHSFIMYHYVGVYSVNFGILSDRSQSVLTGTDGADRLSFLLVDQKPRRHGFHVIISGDLEKYCERD